MSCKNKKKHKEINMKLLITCLRRSGSTTFWKLFRQDRRILCFDEPFNPMLKELPKSFLKKTNTEFINLYNLEKENFLSYFKPINYKHEIKQVNYSDIIKYINYLFYKREHVVIDATRLNFMLDELAPKLPKDVFVIYLYRMPQAFVSSHLIPNRPELLNDKRYKYYQSKVKAEFNKLFFFNLASNFDDWGYETIAQCLGLSKGKAYRKLLHIWKIAYDKAVYTKEVLENRMKIISFGSFCNNPKLYIENLYSISELYYTGVDMSAIKTANPGFSVNSNMWLKAFDDVGINVDRLYDESIS